MYLFFLFSYRPVIFFSFCLLFSSSKAAKREQGEREDRDTHEREREEMRESAGDQVNLRNVEPQDTQNKDSKKQRCG